MRNSTYTLIILFCATLQLRAQDKTIDYIHPDGHIGLFSMAGQMVVLSLSEPAPNNGQFYLLRTINPNLDEIGKTYFWINQENSFYNLVSNENNGVAIFQNANKEVLDFTLFDETGKVILSNTIHGNTQDAYTNSNIIKAEISDIGQLFIVRTYTQFEDEKLRKVVATGLEILCIGVDLKLAWQYKFKTPAENVFLSIEDIVAFNGGCMAMVTENARKDKNFNAALYFINNVGVYAGKTDLVKGDDIYYPTSFVVEKEGIMACGMYFNEPWYKASNSNGMFLMKTDAIGKQVWLQTKDWKSIDATINSGNKSDYLLSGKMQVLVQDVYSSDVGYKVICESYQKAAATTGAELLLDIEDDAGARTFTIFDFIIFDYNKTGNLNKTYRIAKEKRNIEIKGNIAYKRSIELSFLLKEYHLFSYRYVENNEVAYINMENGQANMYWASINSGQILRKADIIIQPIPLIEENPASRALIEGSSVLKGLENLANKMEEVDNKLEAVSKKLERSLTKTDQVFFIGQMPLDGVMHLGKGVDIAYFLFFEQYEVYLRKL